MMHNFVWKANLSILLLCLAGVTTAMSNNDTKFEWLATESAPHHYPMKIIQGTFIYHGETEQGLYVPSGGTLYAGWGEGISNAHQTSLCRRRLSRRLHFRIFQQHGRLAEATFSGRHEGGIAGFVFEGDIPPVIQQQLDHQGMALAGSGD